MKPKSSMMRNKIRVLESSFAWATAMSLGVSNSITATESIIASAESHQHRNGVLGTEHFTGTRMTLLVAVGQPNLNQNDLLRAETLSIVFLKQLKPLYPGVLTTFNCGHNKMRQGKKLKKHILLTQLKLNTFTLSELNTSHFSPKF